MEDKDVIDLKDVVKVIAAYKYRLIAIVLTCTVLALGLAFILPKQYESTTLIRAKTQKQGGGVSLQAAAALSILGGNMQSPTQSYIELMKSRAVLDTVIANLDLPNKEKIDNKGFAKSNLKIQNTKGTDLIEVTATGRTPEEAQFIATNVVSSFHQLLTNMNQSEQSLLVKFLSDRIGVAKKEMEDAEGNLSNFQQSNKIYVPDAQAKATLEKITAYDKKKAELMVENQGNAAKLTGVSDQLAKQNLAASTYNVADNAGIQQIRSKIIEKQLALIDLEQHYTDKHPQVILARTELAELDDKLREEVKTAVLSGTSTLNPLQAELMKQKALTETELLVGQAAVDAISKAQAQSEQEISKLSADGMTYVGLERQVKITQEVYGALVKNYEQARVQEAMESMDIQVVDEADLPKFPSAPRKLLITAIGMVLGFIVGFIYVLFKYQQYGEKSQQLNIS